VAKKISDYINIKEASDLLGVTPGTVKNWEKAGKLNVYRNTANNYRMYLKEELEAFLAEIIGDK